VLQLVGPDVIEGLLHMADDLKVVMVKPCPLQAIDLGFGHLEEGFQLCKLVLF
jgi:hypothetical protein